MPNSGFFPQMRSMERPKDHSWFRIENATVDKEGSDTETTKVYIYDVIGFSWWDEGTESATFIKQLSAIKTPNIELHLNSPGGDIFEGVAIYNALKNHDAKVKVVVDALAASAASFIAQAGDEIVMTKGAMLMIHDGSAGAYGYASDLRKTADILDKLSNNIAGIYADRAGQTPEFWRDLMLEETWYNAAEAVEVGLADREDGEAKDEDVSATNKWMTFFNYAGRGAAPDPLIARQRIANRLKETTVPNGPKNENEKQESQETASGQPAEEVDGEVNPSSPEVDEDAQTTEGQATEVQEEREEQNPANVTTGTISTEKITAGNISGTPVVRFKLGDVEHTMSIQEAGARLAVLENFRNEAIAQGRKDYVQRLAAENKIAAPSIDKLTAYALTLSDEGFKAWSDTFEDAPVLPLLANKTAGNSTPDGPQSHAGEVANSELDTLRGTVAHLKEMGLANEKIEKTPSYMKLVQLDPNFKL